MAVELFSRWHRSGAPSHKFRHRAATCINSSPTEQDSATALQQKELNAAQLSEGRTFLIVRLTPISTATCNLSVCVRRMAVAFSFCTDLKPLRLSNQQATKRARVDLCMFTPLNSNVAMDPQGL